MLIAKLGILLIFLNNLESVYHLVLGNTYFYRFFSESISSVIRRCCTYMVLLHRQFSLVAHIKNMFINIPELWKLVLNLKYPYNNKQWFQGRSDLCPYAIFRDFPFRAYLKFFNKLSSCTQLFRISDCIIWFY